MKVIRVLNNVSFLDFLSVLFLMGIIGCADAECMGYCETACSKFSICNTVMDDTNMNACVDECVRVSDQGQVAAGRTSEEQALHCENIRQQVIEMSCDEFNTAMGF